MIEVEHKPDDLPCKRKVKVWNAAQAYAKVQRMMDSKRLRGMRLRYDKAQREGELWLSARCSEPVRVALRCLRDAGMVRR